MSIYTKSGDDGKTSLIGGKRVPKCNIQIEAYGTVDELVSYIGLIRDQKIDNHHIKPLILIQERLMICASLLASDYDNKKIKLPVLQNSDIIFLEKEIDLMEKDLPKLTSFILPGGHTTVSYCHIARNVCRRAERQVIKLDDKVNCYLNIVKYLNRLSDYFFILSRTLSKELKVVEIKWEYDL
ncbi:MAG: cob(I)yrinic acid a,c-diamide adenosyltransferase [Bacteroidales bacterium]|nr:cob(I)yrinic acid a,c-diamide adenosyltransferase [Bacteroidales bacterium]